MLDPAGTLDIAVTGIEPGERALLSLVDRSAADATVVERFLECESSLRFTGWRPGTYGARLTVGEIDRRVVAQEDVEVRAGVTSSIALHAGVPREGLPGTVDSFVVLPGGDPGFDELAGSIRITLRPRDATGYQLARSSAELSRALSEMQPLGAPELRSWRFERVPPGSYVVVLEPFGVLESFRLESGGNQYLEVALPALARTRLRWVREPGGPGEHLRGIAITPLTIDLADERGELPAEATLLASVGPRLQFLEDAGEYEVLSLPGRLAVRGFDGPTPTAQEIAVASGWNEAELLLEPRLLVTIETRLDDGSLLALPTSSWFEARVEALSSPHALVHIAVRGSGVNGVGESASAQLGFSGPGTYRLSLATPDGVHSENLIVTGEETEPIQIHLGRRR